MYPRDSCFIGAVEGFGFAELELGRFDGGSGRHEGRDRRVRVGGWKGCEERMLLINKEFGNVVFEGKGVVNGLSEGFSR